jgi:hypothetical protein
MSLGTPELAEPRGVNTRLIYRAIRDSDVHDDNLLEELIGSIGTTRGYQVIWNSEPRQFHDRDWVHGEAARRFMKSGIRLCTPIKAAGDYLS